MIAQDCNPSRVLLGARIIVEKPNGCSTWRLVGTSTILFAEISLILPIL